MLATIAKSRIAAAETTRVPDRESRDPDDAPAMPAGFKPDLGMALNSSFRRSCN